MHNTIDLPFLAAKLFNTPHLLAANKLDTILGALAPRTINGTNLPLRATAENTGFDTPPEAYSVYRNIAIIPIYGTLVRRGAFVSSLSGLTSYEGLKQSFTEAIHDPEVEAIMLEIDSPGGEAGGVFDLADYFKALASKHKKPIWAHANEQACSAAYALASVGEQIWLTRTSDVGSIGVVCAHLDQSKQDEKAGQKWTYIYEGDHKTLGNPHEPLNDTAKQKLQAECTAIYNIFVETIAHNRPLTLAHVIATKADTYLGQEAIQQGLADQLGTFDEALHKFSIYVEKLSK